MPETPEVRITRGSPSDDEEAAVREAILKLWREDQAKAARDSGMDPWTLAARAETLRTGGAGARGRSRDAWKLSGRLGAEPASPTQTGRGDAK